MNGQEYLTVYSTSYNSGWNYVVLIPAAEIFWQIYNVQRFFVLLIVIITILVIPVCFLITGTLYKPLEKLVLAMQHVENGNFDTLITDQRRDEYQKVYRGFNLMLGELRRLIEDLSNEKALNKQAEINLIQAQINPHFLYNTLDSIYSIAMIYKVDEISKMAAALSKFFRVSLSSGKTNTSLKEALDIVKSYVTIQNIRFNNKIIYRVSIPAEYLDIAVPKLILQPLAENSIYHGLEKKKGKGRLTIGCVREGGVLRIHVTDDGVGMTEKQLTALRESIYDDMEDSQNFALKTLNRQLMLKYGKEYGLRIDSRVGEGTIVVISLPVPSPGKKAE
jgi:two-component system sensor histidine kinase YesM